MNDFELSDQQERIRWRVRRRFAIIAMIHMILIPLIYISLFFIIDNTTGLKDFNSIVITMIGADMSIIGVYIGAATWSNKVK